MARSSMSIRDASIAGIWGRGKRSMAGVTQLLAIWGVIGTAYNRMYGDANRLVSEMSEKDLLELHRVLIRVGPMVKIRMREMEGVRAGDRTQGNG